MLSRYRMLIILAIIALFCWVAAGYVTTIVSYKNFGLPKPARQEVPKEFQGKKSKDKTYYDSIKSRDLFKIGSSAGLAPGMVDQNARRPIAEIGLLLKGTIFSTDEALARAIIEEKGKQQICKVNDEISGARILAIFQRKVIVLYNGQEQELVPKEPGAGKDTQTRMGAQVPNIPGMGISNFTPPSSPADMSSVMQNMEQFLGKARVVPYFKGGEPYGFRISNVDSQSPVFGMGIRSGDVIRSVNGIPVRSPEDAFKTYQELSNESSVQVEVERGGSTTSVTLPLR